MLRSPSSEVFECGVVVGVSCEEGVVCVMLDGHLVFFLDHGNSMFVDEGIVFHFCLVCDIVS